MPAFARVVGADGAPIAGAEVVFCGNVLHVGPQHLPADVVRSRSDGRGRAQVDLLVGRCYAAWAAAADDQGAGRTSELHGWTGAGAVLELECGTTLPPAAVQLAGAAAWAEAGPVRWFVVGRFVGVEHELLPDEEGKAVLPPLPDRVREQCVLEARSAAGAVLWSAAATQRSFGLPPPCTLELETVDAAGAPIAGAQVHHLVRRQQAPTLDLAMLAVDEVLRPVGVTGADGRVAIRVPFAGDPFAPQGNEELHLILTAAGKVRTTAGCRGRTLFAGGRPIEVPAERRLRCQLEAAQPIEGRVLAAAGRPVAGLRALLHAPPRMTGAGTGTRLLQPHSHVVAVGADGRFVFDDVAGEVRSPWLVLLPPPGGDPLALPSIAPQARRGVPPEIDLAAQAVLRLRIRDERGGPAAGARVFLLPMAARGFFAHEGGVRAVVGPAGTLDLHMLPGQWGLFVLSDSGMWSEAVDAAAGVMELDRALSALPVMRLRLLDADGAPVRGAWPAARGASGAGSSGALASLQQQLSMRLPFALATDADGTLAIPLLQLPGSSLQFVLTRGGRQTALIRSVPTPPDDPPLEVRLQ